MSTSMSKTGRWRRRATCTVASTALIAAGFVALAGPANAEGNTIYVNAGGSSAEDCGASFKACKTIQAGIDNAAPGDKVQVAAGTYNGIVNITKGVTVQGEDKETTVIDGTGLTTPNGLVNINQPGGDVTLSGFTIENQVAPGGGNDDSYGVTINDASADDTVTISGNIFPGVSPARTDENPYGVDSANTLAEQVITDNEFANLWRGILLEGKNGPVTVSDNIFHDLISVPTGAETGPNVGKNYPPKGVYILADGNGGVSDQSITGNTFRDYAGIGLSIRAGYDLGGCDGKVCEGSVTASATNNTFQLDAQPETNSPAQNQQVAAFNVQALDEVDVLDLALSGNAGTVDGQPLVVAQGDGTVNITPTPSPVTLTPASTTFAAGTKQTFTATVKDVLGNPSSGIAVAFDNGDGPGVLNKTSVTTDADGKASVTLVTATDDIGSGTLTATATPASGEVVKTSTYTATAPVGSVTPTLGTLAQAGLTQTVTIKVVNSVGAAPPAGTAVNVTVSGATVASGTVATNSVGNATFAFTTKHAGAFTLQAVAGGKSTTISASTPVRKVTTTLVLTSPKKGQLIATIATSPSRPGVNAAYYFVHGSTVSLYTTNRTTSKGTAAIAIPVTSGGTYTMVARIYGDPDSDAAYSARVTLKAT